MTCFCGHHRSTHADGTGRCGGHFDEDGVRVPCGCLSFVERGEAPARRPLSSYVKVKEPAVKRAPSPAFLAAGKKVREDKASKEWQVIDIPKHKMAGQQAMIYDIFTEAKKPLTLAEITEAAVTKHRFKPNQDPQRAIYYYLNEWKKKGWIR